MVKLLKILSHSKRVLNNMLIGLGVGEFFVGLMVVNAFEALNILLLSTVVIGLYYTCSLIIRKATYNSAKAWLRVVLWAALETLAVTGVLLVLANGLLLHPYSMQGSAMIVLIILGLGVVLKVAKFVVTLVSRVRSA